MALDELTGKYFKLPVDRNIVPMDNGNHREANNNPARSGGQPFKEREKAMKTIKTMDQLKDIIRSSGDDNQLYVRWSRGPNMDSKLGASRDYLNGSSHAGLSAVEINPYWADDDSWLARRVTEYIFLRMKDAKIGCYIYSGKEIGTDSDGYSSIADIKGVAKLDEPLIKHLMSLSK